MTNFQLLTELLDPHEPTPQRTKIKYQTYELSVEEDVISIGIPLRECERFEQYIQDNNTIDNNLKNILRKFRGIRIS